MLKVSVVIPTYNRQKHIARAVDSALCQTYPLHEIIVVDDGSTDSTRSFIKERYAEKVKYIYQQNKKTSAARNNGIRNATGELIAFLDSDDEWLSHKLEKQVAVFERYPNVGMVACDDFLITPEGLKEKPPINFWMKSSKHYINLLHKNFLPMSSVVAKKSALIKAGCFDEFQYCFEDYDMWLRLSEVTDLFVLTDKLSRYHAHNGVRMSTQNREQMFRAAIRVLNKAKDRNRSLVASLKYFFFRRRLSIFYFDAACISYKKGDFTGAFEDFKYCLLWNPFQIKALIFLILSVIAKMNPNLVLKFGES